MISKKPDERPDWSEIDGKFSSLANTMTGELNEKGEESDDSMDY